MFVGELKAGTHCWQEIQKLTTTTQHKKKKLLHNTFLAIGAIYIIASNLLLQLSKPHNFIAAALKLLFLENPKWKHLAISLVHISKRAFIRQKYMLANDLFLGC